MADLINLLFYSFIGSVAGIAGGVLLLFRKKWAGSLAHVSIPLAAGVLLSVSFLHLLPEAVEYVGNTAFQVVLVVFVIAFLIEKYFFSLHHHVDEGLPHTSAVPLVIAGDTIHNFLDGVTIAVAYAVEPSLGLLVAISSFLHETPHEIADFGILLAAGWSRKRVFTTNFLSALATFPGALIGYYFASTNDLMSGVLLSVSAGLFLYVASTDFLPALGRNKENTFNQAFYLVIGILLILFVTLLIPEIGHE
jgi:zinc and cadmium transporter